MIVCNGGAKLTQSGVVGNIKSVDTFIDLSVELFRQNKFHTILPYHTYIPNLFLFVLRESGSTQVFDLLGLPEQIHCPSALYEFTKKIYKGNDVPIPPKHGAIGVYADAGLCPHMLHYKADILAIESYYAKIIKFWNKHNLTKKIVISAKSINK